MLLLTILCNIIFIPTIYSTNTTPKDAKTFNITSPDEEVLKSSILTEGGPAVISTPISSIATSHDTVLKSSSTGKEYKTLSGTPSSRRDPRKGVKYHLELEDSQTTAVETAKTMNVSTTKDQTLLGVHNHTSIHVTITTPSSKESYHNTTHKPKPINKPLILSSEALDQITNFQVSKNMDQLTSTEINKPIKKIGPLSTSRHPGMVMPIVITILVVPMFAVLGYMALRRGQEAWKNRHYKRMDFLLDGMYNE